jgi:2-keto-4-pentenoate hydratase/2-oxohepta-3-ene-1,7-dioic acid hydratase in catechol pathway
MVRFLTTGDEGIDAARRALEAVGNAQPGTDFADSAGRPVVHGEDQVKLTSPIPHPPKLICVGLNYVDHCEETGVPVPEAPFFFVKPWTAVIGPGEPVVIPRMAEVKNHVDYELELAIVIGKRGRHIAAADANGFVAGYTILNDISAREFLPPEFLPMKGFDTFAPLGPCLTLKDQIGNVDDLDVELKVNGDVRQSSNTKNFVFNVARVVSYLSQIVTLEPGDVIGTGTPGGVGWRRDPPVWLHPGDVVEAEIENIGILRNPVVAED